MAYDKLNKLAAACKASVLVEYRRNADYYETLKEATDKRDDYYAPDTFLSEEDRAVCLDKDIYWTLHFYPHTPTGFYHAHASSLDMLLDWALKIMADNENQQRGN